MAELRFGEIRVTLELPDGKMSVVTQLTADDDRLETMQKLCVLLDDWADEKRKTLETKERALYEPQT